MELSHSISVKMQNKKNPKRVKCKKKTVLSACQKCGDGEGGHATLATPQGQAATKGKAQGWGRRMKAQIHKV